MELLSEFGAILSALTTMDSWEIRNALRADGAWVFGAALSTIGGLAILGLYQLVPWLDRHLERTIMVYSYLAIALIIFWGVVDRFIFSNQQPWSTTIPPLLFMIMAWYGAAYNVRLRTHLSFAEFRTNMPRKGQLACLILDAVLWFTFAVIVVTTTLRLTALSASNFQIVLGTDNVLQWWFLLTAPFAFILLTARVFENLMEDFANYRSGKPLIRQAVIGEEAR